MERVVWGSVFALALIALIYFWSRKYDYKFASEPGKARIEAESRNFARLLVAEIKLFEDYKVRRGLETNQLYESLRNEIEAARKKYKRRIPYPELDKYFEEALIDILADGDKSKLGKAEIKKPSE
jgi:hypothetical protein